MACGERTWPGVRGFGRVLVMAALISAVAGCRHRVVVSSPTAAAPSYPPGVLPVGSRLMSISEGVASWYGGEFNGRRSANGEVFVQDGFSAASRTIPLGSLARVTNLASRQAVIVRITDRGPFYPGRIIDLSEGAAKVIGLYRLGVAKVRIEEYAPPGMVERPGIWCVQIGAFAAERRALALKRDLLQRYPTARVIQFKGREGDSWVRITLASPDRNRTSELAAGMHLTDPGVAAYLTRLT